MSLSQRRLCHGNVVVVEAASGALRNRRRKRPPWLLCSESKVLCAFGTALSPTVTVARASIKACLAVERSSTAKACPPAEAAPSSEMSLAAVLRLPTNAFMSRRTCLLPVKVHPSPAGARLPLAPRLSTGAFMSCRTCRAPARAYPSPAGARLTRSKARAIFAMRWSATQKPPSNSSCRARRPHLTFQQGIASFLMGFRFMQPWRTHAFDAREAESRLPFARGRFIHGRSCESTTACT